jgi:hypothetical protein
MTSRWLLLSASLLLALLLSVLILPPAFAEDGLVKRNDSLWGIARRLLGSRATPREVDQI